MFNKLVDYSFIYFLLSQDISFLRTGVELCTTEDGNTTPANPWNILFSAHIIITDERTITRLQLA